MKNEYIIKKMIESEGSTGEFIENIFSFFLMLSALFIPVFTILVFINTEIGFLLSIVSSFILYLLFWSIGFFIFSFKPFTFKDNFLLLKSFGFALFNFKYRMKFYQKFLFVILNENTIPELHEFICRIHKLKYTTDYYFFVAFFANYIKIRTQSKDFTHKELVFLQKIILEGYFDERQGILKDINQCVFIDKDELYTYYENKFFNKTIASKIEQF